MSTPPLTGFLSRVVGRSVLHTHFVLPVAMPILAALGVVGYLATCYEEKTTHDIAIQLQKGATAQAVEQVRTYLNASHQVNQQAIWAYRYGIWQFDAPASQRQYAWEQLRQFGASSVRRLGFVSADGRYQAISQAETGQLTVTATDASLKSWLSYALDAQGQPGQPVSAPRLETGQAAWYHAAMTQKRVTWGLLLTSDRKDPLLAQAEPIYATEGGKFLGVVYNARSLVDLGQVLEHKTLSPPGKIFVMQADGTLLASSDRASWPEAGSVHRTPCPASDRLSLLCSVLEVVQQQHGSLASVTSVMLSYQFQAERYFVQVTPLTDRGLNWRLITVFSESDLVGSVNANVRQTILFALVVLAGILGLGILALRRVIQPIADLSHAASALIQNQRPSTLMLDQAHELDTLARALDQTTQHLQNSFRDLHLANDILEQKIELRTASLVAAETELRALFAAMDDWVIIFDHEGRYLKFVSTPLRGGNAVTYGRIGATLQDIWGAEKAKPMLTCIQQALKTQKTVRHDYSMQVGQREYWYSANISPLSDQTVLWVIRDITHRKQIEVALQAAEVKYRSIFENSVAGIFQATISGRFLSVNPALAKMLGYGSPAELMYAIKDIGRQLYVDPQQRSHLVEHIQQGQSVINWEAQLYRQDGCIIWVSCNANGVHDTEGDLLYVEGTMTEITPRKLAEAALIANEQQLREQNQMLVKLTRNRALIQGDLSAAVTAIAKVCAKVLNVERVSIWLFDPNVTSMRCLKRYERSTGRLLEGCHVNVAHYPTYFQALQEKDLILANDALHDPRLQEWWEPDLVPSGVVSVLHRCIRSAGKPLGIIGLEHVGRIRQWTPEEETFVRSLADLVSLGIEARDRRRAETALKLEQEKSQQLLLNILPDAIVKQLKENDRAIAEHFDDVTILFADIVNFTPLASQLSPIELVDLLNHIFSRFDLLAEHYGVEKIKTVGDEYMVASGLPIPRSDHAAAIADMALAMQAVMPEFTTPDGQPIQIRIGIHTGAAVAGVIGRKKFIYDLWGDTVNLASRMESAGEPGRIQVTSTTYTHLNQRYHLEQRGEVMIKGKGLMTTYWLLGQRRLEERSESKRVYPPRLSAIADRTSSESSSLTHMTRW